MTTDRQLVSIRKDLHLIIKKIALQDNKTFWICIDEILDAAEKIKTFKNSEARDNKK